MIIFSFAGWLHFCSRTTAAFKTQKEGYPWILQSINKSCWRKNPYSTNCKRGKMQRRVQITSEFCWAICRGCFPQPLVAFTGRDCYYQNSLICFLILVHYLHLSMYIDKSKFSSLYLKLICIIPPDNSVVWRSNL